MHLNGQDAPKTRSIGLGLQRRRISDRIVSSSMKETIITMIIKKNDVDSDAPNFND